MTLAGGVVAALLSALAYGSFAVPVKNKAVVDAKVHPLIFQSYKSLMCFLTSWLILLYSSFGFTWWATLAAFIWVMDGVVAIISIHLAGLGVAQTTWSVISLFVSFAWGKLLFKEPMKNLPLSGTGLLLMVVGMLGLGYVASHAKNEASIATGAAVVGGSPDVDDDGHEKELESVSPGQSNEETQPLQSGPRSDSNQKTSPESISAASHNGAADVERQGGVNVHPAGSLGRGTGSKGADRVETESTNGWLEQHRFSVGVGGAAYVGICAGTMMVCLKMAPPDCKGDQYTVSFGIGVGLVTTTVLGIYFGACMLCGRPVPSFHVRVAAGPACLAGILWSLGNYLSILAVASLGMAVGWPLVQCSLIVSNVWALFWYKEVEGQKPVFWFLASSCVILCGVVLLAYYGL